MEISDGRALLENLKIEKTNEENKTIQLKYTGSVVHESAILLILPSGTLQIECAFPSTRNTHLRCVQLAPIKFKKTYLVSR